MCRKTQNRRVFKNSERETDEELQKLRNKASAKGFPKAAQQSNTLPKISKTFTEVNSVPKNASSKTYAQVTKETKLEKQEPFNKQLEKRLSKLER